MSKSFADADQESAIAQYNQELQEGEEEYEAGNFITHEEMVKLIRQWN